MARPREAVGCRTLICRKADSGQLNDLATNRAGRNYYRPPAASLRNHARRSVSSIQFSIRLAVATSLKLDRKSDEQENGGK